MGEEINRNIKGKEKIVKYLKALAIGLGIGGAGGIGTIICYIYGTYLKQPNIECVVKENEITYSVREESRGFTLKLHPQIVIQFDNHIVLLIYLKEYYEEEFLYSSESEKGRKVQTTMQHAEYVNELQRYIKDEIITIICSDDNKISEKEMNKRLKVYVSTLGGIRYTLLEGNEEKRFCVIETEGIVKDYDENSKEILSRLYETQLRVTDDLDAIKADEKISNIIEGVAKEIVLLY